MQHGVPLIRDYPARTLVQARYSWAILRRDLRAKVIDQVTFTRHSARLLAAIAGFLNEQNGRASDHCVSPVRAEDVGSASQDTQLKGAQ